jgi:hypothetical protein
MNRVPASLTLIATLALAGTAAAQNRPNTLAPGATYVNSVRTAGSYGNHDSLNTIRVAGEQMWEGRKVFVYENTTARFNVLTDPESGRGIAMVRGDATLVSWEPPVGWNFPLAVGASWTRTHRATDHANRRGAEYTGTWKVVAFEDVTVSAGTFKAYKVLYTDTLGNEDARWWSPETGVNVKEINRRTDKHPAGAGTREVELVQRPAAPPKVRP